MRFFIALWVVLACVLAAKASGANVEKALRADFENKQFTLRGFPSGGHLEYDAGGKLIQGGTPGPWTLDGEVRVVTLQLRHGVLRLDCLREYLAFVGDDPVHAVDMQGPGKELEIDYKAGHAEEQQIRSGLARIFLTAPDTLEDAVPALWKPFVRGFVADQTGLHSALQGPPPPPSEPTDYEKVGGPVTAPQVLYCPDPVYEPIAQKAGFQGKVVVSLVVGTDGLPRDVQLSRPVGMGLDERAVAAVKTWRFQPAAKDGVPVPVQVNVEVDFRLH